MKPLRVFTVLNSPAVLSASAVRRLSWSATCGGGRIVRLGVQARVHEVVLDLARDLGLQVDLVEARLDRGLGERGRTRRGGAKRGGDGKSGTADHCSSQ